MQSDFGNFTKNQATHNMVKVSRILEPDQRTNGIWFITLLCFFLCAQLYGDYPGALGLKQKEHMKQHKVSFGFIGMAISEFCIVVLANPIIDKANIFSIQCDM
jgi:hypothetical protein